MSLIRNTADKIQILLDFACLCRYRVLFAPTGHIRPHHNVALSPAFMSTSSA